MSHPNHVAASRSFLRALMVIGRLMGWGMLGALCGFLMGLGSGILLAPPDLPGEPVANEWYVPHLLIAILPAETLAGLIVGGLIAVGAEAPAGRRKAFVRALIGAVLGLGLTAACIRALDRFGVQRVGAELWFSFLMQVAGAAIVTGFSASYNPPEKRPGNPGP